MATNNSINDTTGNLTVTAGDVNLQAGNVTLTNTNSSGTTGVVKLGTTQFLSNAGTTNAFVGGAGNFTNTGSSNVGIGGSALSALTTGTFNVAVGASAAAANTTGAFNFALGAFSVATNTTGQQNIGIGVNALRNLNGGNFNLAIGTSALNALVTGVSNTALGITAGGNYTGSESNNVLLNNAGTLGDSGVMRFGTPGTQTSCYVAGVQGVSTASPAIATVDTSTSQLGSISYTQAGTFTPGIAFGGASTGITYNAVTAGKYTQIGNVVFFTIILALTSKGTATGNATLTGMPVNAADATSRAFIAQVQNFTFTANYLNLAWVSAASSTTFSLVQYSNVANQANATDTNFVNNTALRFEGFYFV